MGTVGLGWFSSGIADVVAILGLATWFCVLELRCMVILLFLVSLAAVGDLPLSTIFDEILVECLHLNLGEGVGRHNVYVAVLGLHGWSLFPEC